MELKLLFDAQNNIIRPCVINFNKEKFIPLSNKAYHLFVIINVISGLMFILLLFFAIRAQKVLNGWKELQKFFISFGIGYLGVFIFTGLSYEKMFKLLVKIYLFFCSNVY